MARRRGNSSALVRGKARHGTLTRRLGLRAVQDVVWHVEWVFAGTAVRLASRVPEEMPLRHASVLPRW